MASLLLDTPLVQSIGWALIHFVWQGTVIGVASAMALRILACSRPTVRYAMACFSLALMLTVPVVAVFSSRTTDSTIVVPASAPANVAAHISLDRLVSSAVAVWLAGVLLLSSRLMAACASVERMKRATRAVDASVIARVQWLAQRLGIATPVRAVESTLVRVPTVVGHLRPVILLPASVITGLAPAYLDAVLAHELAHVRRHDYLVNLLQSLIEMLLFYHPAVWWCSRQIRIEREHCCDDMVVEAGGDRMTYATALAQLEELRGLQPMLSLNASGGRLIDRIRRLLGESPANERRSSTWAIAATLAVVAVIVVTPVRSAADVSVLVTALQADGQELDGPQTPGLPSTVQDAGRMSNDAGWLEYVRETQAALETLARETQGVALLQQPTPEGQDESSPQSLAQPVAQPAPVPPNRQVAQPPQPPRPADAVALPQPPQPPQPPTPAGGGAPQPPPPLGTQLPSPAPPAAPAPPVPPAGAALVIDPDEVARQLNLASDELARSFEEVLRATDEIRIQQNALRAAQIELQKMHLESAAAKVQIEVIRKALEEFSARSAASQSDTRELQKQLEALSAEIAKLRAR